MIKITNTDIFGIHTAIKSMRNPLNSWKKSDTSNGFIGDNDMSLAMKLITAGTEHRKFLRMIHVQATVEAPLYWWKEYDTYKVGTVANSCSTMHTIHKALFTSSMFSSDHLESEAGKKLFESTIDTLNELRVKYLETKDKSYWYEIIQLLPSSFNQLRTIDVNYEVLINIYNQRKNHKLDEWHTFCSWIESLPNMNHFLNGVTEDGQTEGR